MNRYEAFQFGIDEMPEWFQDADRKNKIAIHNARSIKNIYVEFFKGYGSVFAYYGDYIIYEPWNDVIYPCSGDLFIEKFVDVIS